MPQPRDERVTNQTRDFVFRARVVHDRVVDDDGTGPEGHTRSAAAAADQRAALGHDEFVGMREDRAVVRDRPTAVETRQAAAKRAGRVEEAAPLELRLHDLDLAAA